MEFHFSISLDSISNFFLSMHSSLHGIEAREGSDEQMRNKRNSRDKHLVALQGGARDRKSKKHWMSK